MGFNPWLILAVVCTSLAFGGGMYAKGRSDGKAVVIAAQAREENIRLETLHLAQMAAAEEIARIQVVNKTIYAKATHQVIEKPVYRECVHEPDALRLLNDSLAGVSSGPAD
jgi:hypothetical protein